MNFPLKAKSRARVDNIKTIGGSEVNSVSSCFVFIKKMANSPIPPRGNIEQMSVMPLFLSGTARRIQSWKPHNSAK